ncbi:MAG TPA: hypothetical protein VHY31_11235 [Streptosporangiaceae bacterium]|jgi:hypothetical protein|nr:hypothetical protein [Streptosporangiaceae bacterium]
MEDIRRDMAQLSRYAEGLEQLLADVDQAAPARSQGTDRSGMVAVAVGKDGLPEAVAVHVRWRERLPAGSLAPAVTEAGQAALRERGEKWSQALERSGWPARLGRLDTGADVAGDPPVPAAFRRPPGTARGGPGGSSPQGQHRTRPLDVLAEEAIRGYDTAASVAARARSAPPPQGRAANGERTLALTVRADGQLTCEADARWVERQTGADLTRVLGELLAAARRGLAQASDATGAARGNEQSAQFMHEILAALGDAARPSPRT